MVTIYTTPSCGQCKMLKLKMHQMGVLYDECNDLALMDQLGIKSVPMVRTEDTAPLLTFKQANDWLKEMK